MSLDKSNNLDVSWPSLMAPYGIARGNEVMNIHYPLSIRYLQPKINQKYMGQVMKLQLSCYLVLLSIDSKTW